MISKTADRLFKSEETTQSGLSRMKNYTSLRHFATLIPPQMLSALTTFGTRMKLLNCTKTWAA